MTAPEDWVKVSKILNITSYITIIPTLLLFIYVFVRIMMQDGREKFLNLAVVCVLMIVSQITAIAEYQF